MDQASLSLFCASAKDANNKKTMGSTETIFLIFWAVIMTPGEYAILFANRKHGYLGDQNL